MAIFVVVAAPTLSFVKYLHSVVIAMNQPYLFNQIVVAADNRLYIAVENLSRLPWVSLYPYLGLLLPYTRICLLDDDGHNYLP
jgi:hypothetical protein